MKEQMTSGEIANKAGVSQKALRIYDEKGLLKPVGYSEGNYRLYDKGSLLILEKIIALKHVGFSLEEIKASLEDEDHDSIKNTLQKQLDTMEAKIYEMQKAAQCIKTALVRLDEEPNWDDVADNIKKMEMGQGADERRWFAASHAADGIEWYEKIYDSLDFNEDDKILDLGCSYGMLWRKNLERLPENLQVDGYDLHGTWADNLCDDLEEMRKDMPQGTDIQVHFKDLEKEETWENIPKNKYNKIIAHYFVAYLNDMEKLVENVAETLTDDGMFSATYHNSSVEHDYWEKEIKAMGLDNSVIKKKRAFLDEKDAEFRELLGKHFGRVEKVMLPGPLRFNNSEELFDRVCRRFDAGKKYFEDNKETFIKYFDEKFEKEGDIIMDVGTAFYHCYKA